MRKFCTTKLPPKPEKNALPTFPSSLQTIPRASNLSTYVFISKCSPGSCHASKVTPTSFRQPPSERRSNAMKTTTYATDSNSSRISTRLENGTRIVIEFSRPSPRVGRSKFWKSKPTLICVIGWKGWGTKYHATTKVQVYGYTALERSDNKPRLDFSLPISQSSINPLIHPLSTPFPLPHTLLHRFPPIPFTNSFLASIHSILFPIRATPQYKVWFSMHSILSFSTFVWYHDFIGLFRVFWLEDRNDAY